MNNSVYRLLSILISVHPANQLILVLEVEYSEYANDHLDISLSDQSLGDRLE